MFRNRCCDRPMFAESNNYMAQQDINVEYPAAMPMMGGAGRGCEMPPVQECPQERVCHREFVHNVPHIVPINTRIINHHVYRHTYTPVFTSCEENVVSNVYDNCPNNF